MLKKLVPEFINKLDAFLLENYPITWMSKIHYVLWHGFVLGLIAAVLGLLVPVDLKSTIPYGLWYFIISLIGFVLLCIWTYNYMIFNKEKHYGSKKGTDAYADFVLVFFAVGIILLTPWPFQLTFSQKVAAAYSDEEILKDITILNENYLYVVDSYGKYANWTDTYDKKEYFNIRKLDDNSGEYFTPYFMSNSAKYPELPSGAQIQARYKPTMDAAELTKKIELFLTTAEKYQGFYNLTAEQYAKKYISLVDKGAIPISLATDDNDNHSYNVREVISNVCNAKYYQLYFYEPGYFMALFFFTLSLSALLVLFKMVYWRQYLLTAVVFIFYPIVAFIFSQLMPIGYTNSSNTSMQFWMTFFVIAATISLFRPAAQTYFKPAVNIMNQAFFVICPYIFLCIILLIHEHTDVFHNHEYPYWSPYLNKHIDAVKYAQDYKNHLYDEYWQKEYDRWLDRSLWAGIVAFVLAMPLFKNLFVKQLALPKKT